MKKLLLFYLFLVPYLGYSQERICMGMGGTSVNFEFPSDSNLINIDTNNVWFIAKPEKQILFLDNSLNHFALFTDTSAYYKSKIISSFNFKLCFGEGSSFSINFFHKYDFEKNKDGGIIETSYDNGLTWQNIIHDTLILNNIENFVNFYNNSDTILSYKNQPGFTGKQATYSGSSLRFTANQEMRQDTILLRFTIVTDSVDANNEGWMLDDFEFVGREVDTKEYALNEKIEFYPNPVKNILYIKSQQENLSEVSIISLLGETILNTKGDNISSINMAGLVTGCYFLICRNSNNFYSVSKIFKV